MRIRNNPLGIWTVITAPAAIMILMIIIINEVNSEATSTGRNPDWPRVSVSTIDTRGQWSNIYRGLRETMYDVRILYPGKLFLPRFSFLIK